MYFSFSKILCSFYLTKFEKHIWLNNDFKKKLNVKIIYNNVKI